MNADKGDEVPVAPHSQHPADLREPADLPCPRSNRRRRRLRP